MLGQTDLMKARSADFKGYILNFNYNIFKNTLKLCLKQTNKQTKVSVPGMLVWMPWDTSVGVSTDKKEDSQSNSETHSQLW